MKNYDHRKIEHKWQKQWAKRKQYETKDKVAGKKNEVLLVEFPYPSGNLHVGHWYAFAMPDIYARYRRATGKNVMYPIGFDAFGLPAENAAIKRGLNPRTWTLSNMAYMKKQLASMGASFDWSRQVATTDPAYYKWTQWQFLQFYKKGLAYQKELPANWCPKDKTVLANEQVVGGMCERCGTQVEQRNMLQWNLRITDYADRLIDDLEHLNWPVQIKDAQKNWIGKSEGAEIDFELVFADKKLNENRGPNGEKAHIKVFTTRADTLYGVTYLALAPEHPWVTLALTHTGLLKTESEVRDYIKATQAKSDIERQENKEKTGVELEGVEAINPATGEKIPLFIADYVLAQYGTGAIMAVPAHDERDFEFAKKFGLPIKQVVAPLYDGIRDDDRPRADLPFFERRAIVALVKHWSEDKVLILDWKKAAWHTLLTGGIEEGQSGEEAARREIVEETGFMNVRLVKRMPAYYSHFYHTPKQRNQFNSFETFHFELTDGEQSEIGAEEHEKHTMRWVPTAEISSLLTARGQQFLFKQFLKPSALLEEGIAIHSEKLNGKTTEEARATAVELFGTRKTTYKLRDWGVSRQRYWGVPIPIIHCPSCGPVAVPDKDLPVKLPEIKDYLPTGDGKSPLAKVTKWVNVKCPKCKGKAERETDTLDTFVDSSWYFLRYADPKNKKTFASPAKLKTWIPVDLYSGGAEHTTMHLLYSRFWHKALYDLKLVKEKEPYLRRMNRGLILGPDGAKMSKSKGNVIDPDAVVAQLGSDTVRLYLAFIGPYNEPGSYPWNPDSIAGVRRFLERVWRLHDAATLAKPEVSLERLLHQTIKKVGEDCEAMKFNTAISAMMIFVNAAEKTGLTHKQYLTFLQLLAPFAPHVTDELWALLKQKGSIHLAKWPRYTEKLLVADTATFVVQVNGKMRGQIVLASSASESDVVSAAHAHEHIQTYLKGEIIKVIFVPGKLLSFVVKS